MNTWQLLDFTKTFLNSKKQILLTPTACRAGNYYRDKTNNSLQSKCYFILFLVNHGSYIGEKIKLNTAGGRSNCLMNLLSFISFFGADFKIVI